MWPRERWRNRLGPTGGVEEMVVGIYFCAGSGMGEVDGGLPEGFAFGRPKCMYIFT